MNNAAFISYRRKTSWATAQYIHDMLKSRGIDVFMDLKNLSSGQFDTALLREIEKRPYFLIILEAECLKRCKELGDWLLRELEHALNCKRIVIPLFIQGFNFGDIRDFLPENVADDLPRFNGVDIPHAYVDAAMDRLCRDFLKSGDFQKGNSSHINILPSNQVLPQTEGISSENIDSYIRRISLKLDTEYVLPERNFIDVLRFTHDGKFLVTGLNKDRVAIWNTATGNLENTDTAKAFLSPLRAIGSDWHMYSLGISPDGVLLATPTCERQIQLWELTGLKPLRLIETVNHAPICLAFSPDGEWLVAGLDNDGEIYSWSINDDFRKVDRVKQHSGRVQELKFHPKKPYFVSCGVDGGIHFWQIVEEEIKEIYTFGGHDHTHVVDIAFSSDGRLFASVSVSGQICIWETENGLLIRELKHEPVARALAFSPDGRLLASGANDRTLKIWSIADGNKLISKKFDHHINTLDFSPDGQYLATSTESSTKVQLWKVISG